jgi:hypothetical protein
MVPAKARQHSPQLRNIHRESEIGPEKIWTKENENFQDKIGKKVWH